MITHKKTRMEVSEKTGIQLASKYTVQNTENNITSMPKHIPIRDYCTKKTR